MAAVANKRAAEARRLELSAHLRPADTSSMVIQVTEQLRTAIVSGAIPPNSRLVELDLAERFGVSRGPIREALRRLELLGLVTLRPNRGAVVRTLSAADVLEVYVLRAALGVVAIRQLIGADLVTDEAVAKLRLLEQRAQCKSIRQALIVETDLAFQSALIEACGLPRIIARFAETTDEVKMFVTSSGIAYPDLEHIVDDNAQLLAACLERDADRAVELWRSRMRTAVEQFLACIPNGNQLEQRFPWLWQLL